MDILEKVELKQGDLTEMDCDAIVNAANNDLKLGGGVAGAIRRKGGEQVQRECDAIGSIPVGGAAITSGGKLKARWVIHAASMQLGGTTTPKALRGSTAHSLRIAAERGLKTIAFPAVGTGIAGFPMRECAEIMLGRSHCTLAKRYDAGESEFRALRQGFTRCVHDGMGGTEKKPVSARILFLCTGNRARSQMAEGLARALAAPGVEIASAGVKPNPKGVHALAIEMLRERGIDAAGQRPKHVDDLRGDFDYVITLCGSAAQECAMYPARRARIHWGLPDPDLAGGDSIRERAMFVEIRDELERRLRDWLGEEGLLRHGADSHNGTKRPKVKAKR